MYLCINLVLCPYEWNTGIANEKYPSKSVLPWLYMIIYYYEKELAPNSIPHLKMPFKSASNIIEDGHYCTAWNVAISSPWYTLYMTTCTRYYTIAIHVITTLLYLYTYHSPWCIDNILWGNSCLHTILITPVLSNDLYQDLLLNASPARNWLHSLNNTKT